MHIPNQRRRLNPQPTRGLLGIDLEHRGLRDLGQHRDHQFGTPPAILRLGQVEAGERLAEQVFPFRQRVLAQAGPAVGVGPQVVIGIFALRDANNLNMYAGFRRQLDRPLGGVQPGVVAVKGEQ